MILAFVNDICILYNEDKYIYSRKQLSKMFRRQTEAIEDATEHIRLAVGFAAVVSAIALVVACVALAVAVKGN
jgi:hypothetical protein